MASGSNPRCVTRGLDWSDLCLRRGLRLLMRNAPLRFYYGMVDSRAWIGHAADEALHWTLECDLDGWQGYHDSNSLMAIVNPPRNPTLCQK